MAGCADLTVYNAYRALSWLWRELKSFVAARRRITLKSEARLGFPGPPSTRTPRRSHHDIPPMCLACTCLRPGGRRGDSQPSLCSLGQRLPGLLQRLQPPARGLFGPGSLSATMPAAGNARELRAADLLPAGHGIRPQELLRAGHQARDQLLLRTGHGIPLHHLLRSLHWLPAKGLLARDVIPSAEPV